MQNLQQNRAPNILRVAIVGPECTGKTALSQALARHFNTVWVPEYARGFLNKLNRPYDKTDLTKIAHGQLRMEDEWSSEARGVLFCDTNLIVIKVWSDDKFGSCDDEVISLMKSRSYDLQLLTNIDVPWENDPQREHPGRREHFMNVYRKETANSGIQTVEISGDLESRKSRAISLIQELLPKS